MSTGFGNVKVTSDLRDSVMMGKEGRWNWLEEYMWEVKKLENQTYITFSRSFTEKGKRKRQLLSLSPFFPEDGAMQTKHMFWLKKS